jgi:hypothetical protein
MDNQSTGWRTQLADERERKTLTHCEVYPEDPFGDVGHNLKMLVAKLARMLDEKNKDN